MDKITIEVVFLYKDILLKINLLLLEEKVISPYMFESAKEIITREKLK